MDRIQEVLNKLKERTETTADSTALNRPQSTLNSDKCPKCDGLGWVYYKKNLKDFEGNPMFYPNGNPMISEYAKDCECRASNEAQHRYKNAMIPEEYENYNFKNFEKREPVHHTMLEKLTEYLKTFPNTKIEGRDQRGNRIPFELKGPSFGFLATYGEQRIKAIKNPLERNQVKKEYNNFGIGKSHLTVAAAKYLIKNGYRVVVVSDPVFITDLLAAKRDDMKEYQNILTSVTEYADFVVWDDLGKLAWTQPREDLYYMIFNELYKQGKPVIFSSNEDTETLTDKIGQAAASRLLKGMCKGFLYPVEGKDQR